MSIETSPAFQFYVKEWRSSRAIMRMSFAQQGMYLNMLLEQWENLNVPDDPAACAELIGGSVTEWTKAWPVLRRKFVPAEESGRVLNLRLETERAKQRSHSKRSSDKGKKGADARWHRHQPAMAQASASHAQPMPNDGFALPIAIAIATPDKRTHVEATENELVERASRLRQETYPRLYAKYRHGAKLVIFANPIELNDAMVLVKQWDDARLEKLATLVLTSDDEWISRTDRGFKVFVKKASWADERLAAWEAEKARTA